jgi:hypothetical protein
VQSQAGATFCPRAGATEVKDPLGASRVKKSMRVGVDGLAFRLYPVNRPSHTPERDKSMEQPRQITVSHEMAEALRGALHEVDVLDPDGELLGRFRSSELITLYNDVKPPESWDELRRRAHEERGSTLDQMLARLGSSRVLRSNLAPDRPTTTQRS